MTILTAQVETKVGRSRGAGTWWLHAAVVFALAALFQIVVMNFDAWTYDESFMQYGALRVLHGLLPYKDFWTVYPPGGYYAIAAAFRLFGVSALSARIVFVVANAISVVAIVYILDRLAGRWWLSRIAALITLVWLTARAAYAFPVYPSLTFVLVGLACMVHRWERGRPQWAWWAGAALGVSALFRHDLGIYALIALGVASIMDQRHRRRSGVREGFVGADAVRLCCGFVVVVLPVAIWLMICVPAHDLYSDFIYFPGALYAKVRSLPFPTFSQVIHGFMHPETPDEPGPGNIEYNIVWLPVLAAVAAVPVIFSRFRRRHDDSLRWTGVRALALMTALMFLKGVVRVQPVHMIPGVVPALVLLACLLPLLPGVGIAARAGVLFVTAWALFCVLASAHTDYLEFWHNLRMLHGPDYGQSLSAACHPAAGLERARCVFLPDDGRQAILFLQSESQPNDVIFVGVPRYDLLHLSDIEFYFYSDREAATKWYDLIPGVETTAPIQNEMVCDIERNRTRFVVRDNAPVAPEPNESRVSSGVDVLGEYIDRNYAVQRRFGLIDVLVRTTPFAAPGVYCNG